MFPNELCLSLFYLLAQAQAREGMATAERERAAREIAEKELASLRMLASAVADAAFSARDSALASRLALEECCDEE